MGTYTVLGLWLHNEPVSVGVIAGEHGVTGGDTDAFEEGLWATSVDADDPLTAEALAIAEMEEGNR